MWFIVISRHGDKSQKRKRPTRKGASEIRNGWVNHRQRRRRRQSLKCECFCCRNVYGILKCLSGKADDKLNISVILQVAKE